MCFLCEKFTYTKVNYIWLNSLDMPYYLFVYSRNMPKRQVTEQKYTLTSSVFRLLSVHNFVADSDCYHEEIA